MNEEKLFIVEFGEPQMQNIFAVSGSPIKPIYVIANDYNGASIKASTYLLKYLQKNPQSILDSDGSLKSNKPAEIQIIAVKLLSDEIIR